MAGMNARRRDGFSYVQAMIHDAAHDLENCRDDPAAARRSESQERRADTAAAMQHQRRSDVRTGPAS